MLAAEPEQPRLWYCKALALVGLSQWDEAIAAAQTALNLNPTLAAAHRLIGKAQTELGQTELAIAAYKQAAKLYLQAKDRNNAQACIQRIEALTAPKPTHAPATAKPTASSTSLPLITPQSALNQAREKLDRKRYGEALHDLNWLVQCDPDNARILALRGLAHAHCGNSANAMRDLAAAINLAPDSDQVLLQRAKTRCVLGDGEGAIADCTALLSNQGTRSVAILNLRAQAYQLVEQFEKAIADCSIALDIEPDRAASYARRGEAYEALENWDAALVDYGKASRLANDQGDWTAHRQMQAAIEAIAKKQAAKASAAEGIIRVPIKSLQGGTPVIEVRFNDSVSCNMILDTGAGITCITQRLGDLLNVVPTGTERLSLADGRIITAPVGRVQSLAVGAAVAENLQVSISPTATEGLLGQNFLSRYNVRILRTEVELQSRDD